MKCLVMDLEFGCGMDLVMRAQDAGHEVRYWLGDTASPVGMGLTDIVEDWKPSMDWADLIVLTANSNYPPGFEKYFRKGYPIFGATPEAAKLELDRGFGQKVLERHGIPTLPYEIVSSAEEALELLVSSGKSYVMKPWGDEADKALTAVPKDVNEAIFIVSDWKKKGLFKGQMMMQEKVNGVEIGISSFFGPGGWTLPKEESFEHKKFMNGDLGQNTGEQGTVIQHSEKSKLFELLLEPLTDFLHKVKYVGDAGINCIVDDQGTPWPLEFTMRTGWPDFCIRQSVIEGDPLEWMANLVNGEDSLDISDDCAVGIVMAHGDYPWENDAQRKWSGFPIAGAPWDDTRNIHWQQVMDGRVPRMVGGRVKDVPMMVTAGVCPLVVTGTGRTVREAQKAAYALAKVIRWPSNVMYRTDIGDRLKDQLPELHKLGYAKEIQYAGS
ncbi:MAG: phosphoribosylglycinamide synthetase C domain-containing protein [Candidatus Micrarchaeaceae archaeon]